MHAESTVFRASRPAIVVAPGARAPGRRLAAGLADAPGGHAAGPPAPGRRHPGGGAGGHGRVAVRLRRPAPRGRQLRPAGGLAAGGAAGSGPAPPAIRRRRRRSGPSGPGRPRSPPRGGLPASTWPWTRSGAAAAPGQRHRAPGAGGRRGGRVADAQRLRHRPRAPPAGRCSEADARHQGRGRAGGAADPGRPEQPRARPGSPWPTCPRRSGGRSPRPSAPSRAAGPLQAGGPARGQRLRPSTFLAATSASTPTRPRPAAA